MTIDATNQAARRRRRTLRRLAILAPPLTVAGITSLVGTALASQSTGVVFARSVNFSDNVVRNGCRLAAVSQVGSNAHYTGTTYVRVASGSSCATITTVGQLKLHVLTTAFKNGSYCGGVEGWNNNTASYVTATLDCALGGGGTTYQTVVYPGWYKGANCTPSDNCDPSGYTGGYALMTDAVGLP